MMSMIDLKKSFRCAIEFVVDFYCVYLFYVGKTREMNDNLMGQVDFPKTELD